MKTNQDARQNTFEINRPALWLEKMDWEIKEYAKNVTSPISLYIAIDVALTANHLLDWIGWETEDKKRCDEAEKNTGISFSRKTTPEGKIKLLREFARHSSEGFKALEQIALAAKHRMISDFDPAIETMVQRNPMDGGVIALVNVRIQTASEPVPRFETYTWNIFMLATHASQTLWRLYDDCCLKSR